MTDYNPQVWGPHYWFVLYTIASTYPDYPNEYYHQLGHKFLVSDLIMLIYPIHYGLLMLSFYHLQNLH